MWQTDKMVTGRRDPPRILNSLATHYGSGLLDNPQNEGTDENTEGHFSPGFGQSDSKNELK